MQCRAAAVMADIFGAERLVNGLLSALAAEEDRGVGVDRNLCAAGNCILGDDIEKRLYIFGHGYRRPARRQGQEGLL